MISIKWNTSLITALMVLFPLAAHSASSSKTLTACVDCSGVRMVSTVRTNCSYQASDGRCEKTCPTGSLYMETPAGFFACVKVKDD